jgi:hypothetical protein
MTATAVSSRCMPTWCWASITTISRTCWSSKEENDYELDTDITADQWAELISRYKAASWKRQPASRFRRTCPTRSGAPSVLCSSLGSRTRAITYRKLNEIPDNWGTAVNVQAMVFGNMGETSATGVAFTRNPSTGEGALWRVSRQRAGRGRGRRHPHAAEHHRESRAASRPAWTTPIAGKPMPDTFKPN